MGSSKDLRVRGAIKVDSELWARLKEAQYREWKLTGKQPTYSELITAALEKADKVSGKEVA